MQNINQQLLTGKYYEKYGSILLKKFKTKTRRYDIELDKA